MFVLPSPIPPIFWAVNQAEKLGWPGTETLLTIVRAKQALANKKRKACSVLGWQTAGSGAKPGKFSKNVGKFLEFAIVNRRWSTFAAIVRWPRKCAYRNVTARRRRKFAIFHRTWSTFRAIWKKWGDVSSCSPEIRILMLCKYCQGMNQESWP